MGLCNFDRSEERRSVKGWSFFKILYLAVTRSAKNAEFYWQASIFLRRMKVWCVLFTNMTLIFGFFFQVTGKALMLDEIINYVQSLQRQVEVKWHLWIKKKKKSQQGRMLVNLYVWFQVVSLICMFLVQFLSMKLASVNTRLDFNMDALMSKEVGS